MQGINQRNLKCLNCGNLFTGNFCNHCGEKVYHEHEKTFNHFIGHSFHFLTHLDNKFLRSLFLVFRRPGFLSFEISRGVRKKYFPPLNLFLIGVILYLLFPLFKGLNMSLDMHLQQSHSFILKPFIDYKLRDGQEFSALSEKYSRLSSTVAKPLLLIIIPLCALFMALIFRKKRCYFYDHMTLSAEINTFQLFLSFILMPFVFMIVSGIASVFNIGGSVTFADKKLIWFIGAVLLLYNIVAFRRFYGENYPRTIFKSVLFLIWQLLVIFFIYRIIHVLIVLLFI